MNNIVPKTLPVEKQFLRRLIKQDTWILNGFSPDMAAPHPHVLIGEKAALVIDSTDLDLSLREYIEQHVTDKPLMVASTHSHGDHTKNNYMFEDCPIYMTQTAWEEVQANREKFPERTPGNYVPTIIKDGDIIDLGGRQIECIEFCGCHSKSSIAYLDLEYGCLFTGDEFEGGQVLLLNSEGNSCVELYRDNLLELKRKVDGRANCICPPHNGSPCDILLLDYMIENCEHIMAGHEGMEDVRSMTFGLNPHGNSSLSSWIDQENHRRSEWMGTALVYSKKRVRYSDCIG